MGLEEDILRRIVPTSDEVRSIKERADRLHAMVIDYMKTHGYDVEVRFAGSFSKGTFLSNPDLDLFMMFPEDVPKEDLVRIGLQAGKDILGGRRMFSDHPYTTGKFEGLDVDMVPCYHLRTTDRLQSAVDRTPFHTAYITTHLTPPQRDQVRLLKKFMKGIGTYGAEQDSRGFSGYLCEILVVRYGSFRGVLEAATNWKENTVVTIEKKGPSMMSPLVVYDPVDCRRNAASSVHIDTLCLFIHAAREYLEEPREEFFFPKERTPLSSEELSKVADDHGCRLVSVVFDRPDLIEDSLYSQLWKTQYALARKLNEFSFNVLRAVHSLEEDRLTLVFEVERDMLSKTHRHFGPPVWVKSSDRFLDKWAGNEFGDPFIEDGEWVVIAERPYFTAKEMLEDEVKLAGIGRDLDPDTMKVIGHEETFDEVDPSLITELLVPKMPWENRADRRNIDKHPVVDAIWGPVG
ncbi:MAG: CCA tRNA nucleotidyltransferase [Candidatus Methanomethylophilaceae archaeon]|nr:CCA tRNA nucleotidyltransferase [Candidatus Methanomethylophilaceae archaeon]